MHVIEVRCWCFLVGGQDKRPIAFLKEIKLGRQTRESVGHNRQDRGTERRDDMLRATAKVEDVC